LTIRTRTFLGVFLVTAIALAVSTILVERALRRYMDDDIEVGLLNQVRLAGELLSNQPVLADPDTEADKIGRLIDERVTFIAADGTVVGDSAVDRENLATLENHLGRDEVRKAAAAGEGMSARSSHTTGVDTRYAAKAVQHGPVAFVRVALPLTRINERLAGVRRLALIGLGAGLAAALVLTAVTSLLLNRRLRAVALTAARYKAGDFSRPARDHARDEIGMVADVLDDTAQELGTRLTDMSRERAHRDAILTAMVEGVVLVNSTGRLVLANPAVRSMLRLPDPVEERHYLEVVRHPDIARALESALAGRTEASIEVQLDRDPRRVSIARVVPVARERGGGAVLVLHDITDLRHADQVRRDFVANVSHELRTPLTAIRGYVEALLDAPPPPTRAQEFLEIISRHALRMERLVRDLLRLARLDAGQETIERAPCHVQALVAGVEHDLEPLLRQRRLRLAVDIDTDAATVPGDPGKLHDVLRNLIENAANYSPEGETIEITSRRVAANFELRVADHGAGVPEADVQRIFERFYRVDRSRSRDPGGTGLGLSIVRHLVQLHGGDVSVANRPSGGAMFTVTLPARGWNRPGGTTEI
jgi:two-component system phosphate regulon sensor histidine kinase PhoR